MELPLNVVNDHSTRSPSLRRTGTAFAKIGEKFLTLTEFAPFLSRHFLRQESISALCPPLGLHRDLRAHSVDKPKETGQPCCTAIDECWYFLQLLPA